MRLFSTQDNFRLSGALKMADELKWTRNANWVGETL